MHPRTTTSGRAAHRRGRTAGSYRRPPSAVRRPGLYLGVASAGAVLVNAVLFGGEPVAQAEAEPVSVAAQLGLTAHPGVLDPAEDLAPLQDLAASRSERDAAQSAAQKTQAAADRAELGRQKAAARAKARAEAEAKAKAAAAAEAAEQEQAAEREQEQEEAEVAPPAASTAVSATARINNSAGPIRPAAQAAADAVVSNVPCAAGLSLGGTRPSAADPGGHPSGLAVDYMVMSDAACGDAIVQYHIANWDALGVDYIIWQQRYLASPGGGWSSMGDRGSATANHMDHPHVNYRG